VGSWDWLPTTAAGAPMYVWSRRIVDWRIAETEVRRSPTELIKQACRGGTLRDQLNNELAERARSDGLGTPATGPQSVRRTTSAKGLQRDQTTATLTITAGINRPKSGRDFVPATALVSCQRARRANP